MINLTKKVICQALDCVQQATLIVNARKADLPIAYVNPAIEILVGADASELIGSPLRNLVSEGELPEPGCGTFNANTGERDPQEVNERFEQVWKGKDGKDIPVCVQASPLYDRPGTPGYWMLQIPAGIASAVDASNPESLKDALTDARRQLKKLERADTATGIPNRAVFMETLQRDWSMARREQRCLGLIIFEVDAFAEYRDLFGRHAADSVLRKIGHAISGSVRRAGDLAARYDQDRFAVLIGSTNEIQAQGLAENIAAKVRNLSIHHPRSPLGRFLTLSFGVASEVPAWSAKSSELLTRAEEQQVRNRPQPEEDDAIRADEAATN